MRVPLPEDFLRLPIAHRAYHDAEAKRPENSLPAIRAALPDLTILICGEPEGMAGRVEDWLAAHADAPAAPRKCARSRLC